VALDIDRRSWLATAAVILLVLVVWKLVDYRMQPPPPPRMSKQPAMP
jgi:hypothetical protein